MSAAAISPLSDFEKLKIRTTDAKDSSDLKAVNTHLRDWITHAFDRMNSLRGIIEKSKELEIDRKAVEAYRMIANGIKDEVSKRLSKLSDRQIRVIRRDIHIQAICSFYIDRVDRSVFPKDEEVGAEEKIDALYVGAIVTAPWNLPLYGEVIPGTASFVTKGAGTVLLLSLIKDAFFHKCSYLYLKPMEGSVGFYEHLQMKVSGPYYYLDLRLKISDVFTKNVKAFQYKEGEAPIENIS